jgi:hypothetical protein
MRRHLCDAAVRRATLLVMGVLAAAALLPLAGCGGGGAVEFHYPGESMAFPRKGDDIPRLYVEFVNDLRPGSQRAGEGGLATFRFPSDENWASPVAQIYYEALVQDLTQTDLVEIVPLRSQADYTLEVDLNHMGCKITRHAAGYVLAAAAGGGIGYAAGRSSASAVAGALLGIGAIPVPARMKAVCEVKLRVYDGGHEVFFERQCLGEVTRDSWQGLTARKEQEWVDEHLTVAVKRCNACLLGQLRQALLQAGEGDG